MSSTTTRTSRSVGGSTPGLDCVSNGCALDGHRPTDPGRAHPDFLKVIKDLGNGSIHTNGGDISKQHALDSALLAHVRATMQELLELVYEEPTRRATRLSALQSVAKIVT